MTSAVTMSLRPQPVSEASHTRQRRSCPWISDAAEGNKAVSLVISSIPLILLSIAVGTTSPAIADAGVLPGMSQICARSHRRRFQLVPIDLTIALVCAENRFPIGGPSAKHNQQVLKKVDGRIAV
jgi:hypothetical protein